MYIICWVQTSVQECISCNINAWLAKPNYVHHYRKIINGNIICTFYYFQLASQVFKACFIQLKLSFPASALSRPHDDISLHALENSLFSFLYKRNVYSIINSSCLEWNGKKPVLCPGVDIEKTFKSSGFTKSKWFQSMHYVEAHIKNI